MGYVCFRCKARIPGVVKSLFIHLRAVHHVNHAASYFQCCEIGCGRTFSYMRSFRRHLEQHENVEVLGVPTEEPIQPEFPTAEGQSAEDVEEWDEIEPQGITDRVALFLAHLRSVSSQTLSGIHLVVEQTSSLISDIVGRLQSRTMAVFSSLGHNQSPEVEQLMLEFQDCAEPFRDLDTEYKQMQYFVKLGGFIEPVEETFPGGVSYVQKRDSATGTVKQVAVPDTFQRVPLTRLLGQVLEMPGILQAMLDWQQRVGGVLQDVFDGEFCKEHPLFLKETSIPLLLYNDDCETVNPLGSKTGTHKLGFIYFLIKSLPPDLLSSLRSHFLCAVYRSDDAKTYSLDDVLRPIVAELQVLEKEGITVDTPTFKGVVKFSLVQVVGDNLGLNAILGYTESFSANHMCRRCRVHKHVSAQQTLEDPAQLRNIHTHQADLELASLSETGLKRDSELNNLSFYHVTDNVAPDIMHDILEGVGPLEVKLILNTLIEQKHVTLDQINYRLTSFDYGFCDKANKPSVISKNDLRNPEGAMRQSAAQMWCLIRLLPTMIGDLIPEGNKEWELLLLLLLCMEFIFSPSITVSATLYLAKIIEEHHSLFLELFPESHLRPKHHFMVHYPQAIRKLGPLMHLWSMRFEAKHNFFKRVSHITCNFRNICKTMAYRHQMQLCYHFLSGSVLSHTTEVGPGPSTFLSTIDGFKEIQNDLTDFPVFSEVLLPAWVTFKGTKYRPGMTVFLSYDSDGEPQFGLIKSIILLSQMTHTPTTKFVIQKWETKGFERHFHAYSVTQTQTLAAVDPSKLLDHHTLHAVKSYREHDDCLYISLRYRIF